jgi:hypothetical protein
MASDGEDKFCPCRPAAFSAGADGRRSRRIPRVLEKAQPASCFVHMGYSNGGPNAERGWHVAHIVPRPTQEVVPEAAAAAAAAQQQASPHLGVWKPEANGTSVVA